MQKRVFFTSKRTIPDLFSCLFTWEPLSACTYIPFIVLPCPGLVCSKKHAVFLINMLWSRPVKRRQLENKVFRCGVNNIHSKLVHRRLTIARMSFVLHICRCWSLRGQQSSGRRNWVKKSDEGDFRLHHVIGYKTVLQERISLALSFLWALTFFHNHFSKCQTVIFFSIVSALGSWLTCTWVHYNQVDNIFFKETFPLMKSSMLFLYCRQQPRFLRR